MKYQVFTLNAPNINKTNATAAADPTAANTIVSSIVIIILRSLGKQRF